MYRLGLAAMLLAATAACDKSTTPPEPTPQPAEAEPEPEVTEPEGDEPDEPDEPEPSPKAVEISEIHEATYTSDGFEARDFECLLPEPMKNADRYIAAGLADAAEALDACAPKGAAVEVKWSYVSAQAANLEVVAGNQKLADCVAKAMGKARANVNANCHAILLLGDSTAAAAAYDAR